MNRRVTKYIFEEHVKIGDSFNYIATPINKILYHRKSRYQDILVAETPFGRTLFLDNILQFTEYDYEIYHKALIIPSFKKEFNNILILGGGDLLAAQEIIDINPHAKISIVDIDPAVTRVVKKYFNHLFRYDFRRLKNIKLINQDAYEYVSSSNEVYHYIVNDLTDLREMDRPGSQVNRFYQKDFLEIVRGKLSDDGVAVYHLELYPVEENNILKFIDYAESVFEYIEPYLVYIPSFGGLWTFTVLSSNRIKIKENIELSRDNRIIKIISLRKFY